MAFFHPYFRCSHRQNKKAAPAGDQRNQTITLAIDMTRARNTKRADRDKDRRFYGFCCRKSSNGAYR
ncbi:hypothetical protein, partial [Accumulibacter sp.]|uniref:hypothetical protein n=1 Tax=Accumulibacter sp. TaxID=2053492 RepID=UPI0026377DB9